MEFLVETFHQWKCRNRENGYTESFGLYIRCTFDTGTYAVFAFLTFRYRVDYQNRSVCSAIFGKYFIRQDTITRQKIRIRISCTGWCAEERTNRFGLCVVEQSTICWCVSYTRTIWTYRTFLSSMLQIRWIRKISWTAIVDNNWIHNAATDYSAGKFLQFKTYRIRCISNSVEKCHRWCEIGFEMGGTTFTRCTRIYAWGDWICIRLLC